MLSPLDVSERAGQHVASMDGTVQTRDPQFASNERRRRRRRGQTPGVVELVA